MPRLKPQHELGLQTLRPEPRSVVDRYLLHRRRHRAASTFTRDRSIVVRWACWCAAHGVEIGKARAGHAEDFIGEWPWSPSTRRQAITDLTAFYAWLIRHELCTANPFQGVERPRVPRRIPVVLTERELTALPGAMDRPTVRDLRDRAILLALEATGARIGEVRSMDMDKIHLQERYAIVHTGKGGGKDRIVRLDAQTAEAIGRWLQVRRIWARDGRAVFVGRHGARIGYTACHDMLHRAAERAGILRRIYPHLFRHTFATDALAAGANLREVQELLGHERITTTEIYTHVDPRRLAAVYERIRPSQAPAGPAQD